MNTQPATATEGALYRAALEAERADTARRLAAKRAAGTVRGGSASRRRRKHGRPR